ncbi:MAG: cellulase family glycosylhydrolase [Verrucomicrobia bacterium]|nr:cellulase family glycosylhydrolase [Verrucomicrobiota bacterium]
MKPAPYRCCVATLALLLAFAGAVSRAMEPVRVSEDGKGFVLKPSGKRFVPWGHNYACNGLEHGGRIDWVRVAADFDDLRGMGANVARIHLQVPHFMDGPDRANPEAHAELKRLLKLAEKKGVYLDVTGLASYDVHRRATWYDSLPDGERWKAQERFWEAIANTCAKSPAVFCYDLANEPTATGKRPEGWYMGRMGDFEFCQRLTLDQPDRPGDDIFREWTKRMIASVRKHEKTRMITLGMLPFPGPAYEAAGRQLDFISPHLYPKSGKVAEEIAMLRRFDIGKPIVIEETFPLSCGVEDERGFLLQSRGIAAGWIGQYPSDRPGELRELKRAGRINIGQSMYLGWIELFEQLGPEMTADIVGRPVRQ